MFRFNVIAKIYIINVDVATFSLRIMTKCYNKFQSFKKTFLFYVATKTSKFMCFCMITKNPKAALAELAFQLFAFLCLRVENDQKM